MLVDFKLLSDSSKLWVFQSDKIITPSNQKFLIDEICPFLNDWSSHGAEIKASFEIRYNLFLIVSVDEEINSASGCSIDKLTNFIIHLSEKIGVDFFNRLNIAYKSKSDKINLQSLSNFKILISEGKINEESIVFNNLIKTKKDYIEQWEVQLKNSWHNTLLT
jgi:hypothetical protein